MGKIDISKPRYDQETYLGRARHFSITTNPLNLFVSSRRLEDARNMVISYKSTGILPPGKTEEDLWRAKNLYDSAFHPDTGEKMYLIGRMSAQVPMNMLIGGGMLTFYKSTPSAIFWQWLNQSFNALVNYTNRSGDITFSGKQLATSYVLATSGAVATAVALNKAVTNAPPLVGRLVPLVAVAVANCINIPMMRSRELAEGTPIHDDDDNKYGYSRIAARFGIAQVVLSRICLPLPAMILTPLLMNYLEQKGVIARRPWINLPLQIGFVGLCLVFATPLTCAFFKQQAKIAYSRLEPEIKVNSGKLGWRTLI